ncbi:hypothetical protein CUT44_18330 [Streptomyces carminius]|uniref:Uncharacterized protein n=1 Tax=Streptomyces carminius TaxID=2665496 RepID=A0A2M8LWW3_9ACTN|nr:hypothetical protein [Streptomyces carminius]PJE96456.1 hypothetical protein CUT44_18330 [Streptomyces carminius]
MSTPALPLPPELVPAGVRPWRSADTGRWLAAAPARWAHPLWSFLALLAAAMWCTAAAPPPPCTTAEPCGADWWGLAFTAAVPLTLYWVWRQPRWALAGLGAILVGTAAEEGLAGLLDPPGLALSAAAAWTATALLHRLAAAERRRRYAERAAGPAGHPLPAAARTFRRGRFSFGLAAPLLAVAGFGLWQAEEGIGAYERWAAGAERITATVTGADGDGEDDGADGGASVLTAGAGNRTYRVETGHPEDYPPGTAVELLSGGGRLLLASEPYDILGWELLVLAAGVPGVAFAANGAVGRRRSVRLRRGRVPVLRVLVREGQEDARTWVYAADDLTAATPVLHFHSLHSFEDEDGGEDGEGSGDDAGGGDGVNLTAEDLAEAKRELGRELREIADACRGTGTGSAPPLREALLFGAPYPGAEVALLTADGGEPAVECSVTPVKPAGPGLRDLLGAGSRPRPRKRANARRPVEEAAAAMAPADGPRSWSADSGSRAVGLFLLVLEGGFTWAVLGDGSSWVSWQTLVLVLGLRWLIGSVSTAFGWRVTADRGGLWVTGAWRVRRVPWERLGGAEHTADRLRLRLSGDEVLDLSPVGVGLLGRRAGGRTSAARAAEEIRVLLYRPGLRPAGDAAPAEQGMPLGPVVVVLSALWTAAVLLLL